MEETASETAQPDQTGHQPQRGLPRQSQPQRVLAHESELIQSPPPAPSPSCASPSTTPTYLMEQGVPELRLPRRDSGMVEAKPVRRADEGGKYLDPTALR